MDKKVCPMQKLYLGANGYLDGVWCVESQCAWWCEITYMGKPNGGNCAILLLSTKPLNVSIAR